jgi:hypothetical protein
VNMLSQTYRVQQVNGRMWAYRMYESDCEARHST